MNNLSSYCGLTDSRMRASDTDLPVADMKKGKINFDQLSKLYFILYAQPGIQTLN